LSTGDGGPATLASVNLPYSLAVDESNNYLYIGEMAGCRVRRLDLSTNNITTFAGTGATDFSGDNGPATNASFYGAGALVLDNVYNILYIAGTIGLIF
jgi:DNA-binding beta-propeller fold protein YncE